LRLVCWVCWTLSALWCVLGAPAALAQGVIRLESAQVRLEPRGVQAQIATVKLPHRWDKLFPQQDGRAHYTLNLPALSSDKPIGIFIPRVGNQVSIRLGGQEVLHVGELGDPQTDAAKAPVWLQIPPSVLLQSASATLEIEVTAQAGRWGGLSEVYVGPVAQVLPRFEHNAFWRQDVGQVIVVGLLIMGTISAGLWLRQGDVQFGLFALASYCGVVRMADRLMAVPPLPWPWWGGITAMAFALHLIFVAQFAVHVVGFSNRWTHRGFAASAVLASVSAVVAFILAMPTLWTVTLALLTVPGLLALTVVVWRAWTTRSLESILMTVAGGVVIVAGVRDFLVVRLWSGGNATFSILPMASFILVLFMAWVIVERYSRQVQQFRRLAQSLEQRVAERESELQVTYGALQAEQRQQAALQERQRIMRDIHDGVGAHLVGLLSMMRKGNVPFATMEEHAKAALDELRIAVDALQPVNGDLATVLATLRYRLQPRFEAAGLTVLWDVAALPVLTHLTPQVVLQIQRLLLEAFTNVLRHANASQIQVKACVADDARWLVLEVADNGVGWPAVEAMGRGHGLNNMRTRAAAIGAQLTLSERPGGGACVHLAFPLT